MDKGDAVHTHSEVPLSQEKKEMVPCAAAWVHLEMIILSEARWRKTDAMCYHLYVESKKMIQIYVHTK